MLPEERGRGTDGMGMSESRNGGFVKWLASPRTRGWLHALFLILGAAVVLIVELHVNITGMEAHSPDKEAHFHLGRMLATAAFLLAYTGIIARTLLAGRSSLTRVLLWLPALLVAALGVVLGLVLLVSLAKEALDTGGGLVEWADVLAAMRGASTLIPAVAAVMAFTPLLIPVDALMQLPKLMRDDVRTGIEGLDEYVKANRIHKAEAGEAPDVLLVEDDVVCATVALNFCRAMKLRCAHVTTVSEGERILARHQERIRLIMLDNFVRVDQAGSNKTGSEWLKDLAARFGPGERTFRVALISGHTSILGPEKELADIVLQKPWEPATLAAFLREHRIIGR